VAASGRPGGRHARPGVVHALDEPAREDADHGRIEAYSAQQIDGSYTVVNGGPGFQQLIRQRGVTGVVTRNQTGIRRLGRAGFQPVYHGGQATYLMSRACPMASDQK